MVQKFQVGFILRELSTVRRHLHCPQHGSRFVLRLLTQTSAPSA